MTTWQVVTAVPDDRGELQRIFREAGPSNAGDRANLPAHPEALLLGDVVVALAAGFARIEVTASPQALDFNRDVGLLRNGDAATPLRAGPAKAS